MWHLTSSKPVSPCDATLLVADYNSHSPLNGRGCREHAQPLGSVPLPACLPLSSASSHPALLHQHQPLLILRASSLLPAWLSREALCICDCNYQEPPFPSSPTTPEKRGSRQPSCLSVCLSAVPQGGGEKTH